MRTVALATHYILDATRALRAVRSARKSGTVGLSCATHMAAPRVYMPLLHRRKHDVRILLCFHSGSLTQITSHGYSARRRLAWCPLPLSAHSSRRRWNASFGAVSSYVPCCGDRLQRLYISPGHLQFRLGTMTPGPVYALQSSLGRQVRTARAAPRPPPHSPRTPRAAAPFPAYAPTCTLRTRPRRSLPAGARHEDVVPNRQVPVRGALRGGQARALPPHDARPGGVPRLAPAALKELDFDVLQL